MSHFLSSLKSLTLGLTALLSVTFSLSGTAIGAENFDSLIKKAKGQTVYFNAWGGSPQINSYIAWAGSPLKSRYGVNVVHVKLTETADAVARILAEKSAGKNTGGSVDLVWVNGEP